MMKSKTVLLLLAICICIIVSASPVSAANESVNTYTIHDEPYTPFPIFAVVFGIGMMFLILSVLLPLEQKADLFATLAIIPLFVAGWMANQLDISTSGIIGDGVDAISMTEHHIYPATILATIVYIFGVVAILRLIMLLTETRNLRNTKDYNDAYGDDE